MPAVQRERLILLLYRRGNSGIPTQLRAKRERLLSPTQAMMMTIRFVCETIVVGTLLMSSSAADAGASDAERAAIYVFSSRLS